MEGDAGTLQSIGELCERLEGALGGQTADGEALESLSLLAAECAGLPLSSLSEVEMSDELARVISQLTLPCPCDAGREAAHAKPPITTSFNPALYYYPPDADYSPTRPPRPYTVMKRATMRDPDKYKTVMCANWTHSGNCKYGENCQFAHGLGELRRLPPSLMMA